MEIDIDLGIFRCAVQRLLQMLPSTAGNVEVLQEFLTVKNHTEKHICLLFEFLSAKLLDVTYTEPIGITFEQCLLLLLTKAVPSDEVINENNFINYQRKCLALSKLMHLSPVAKRYGAQYFRYKPAPFQYSDIACFTKPAAKKLKTSTQTSALPLDELAVIKCCFQLLSLEPEYFKDLWNWSTFVEQYCRQKNENELKTIYCNHILSILTNMTATQLYKWNASLSPEIQWQFDAEQNERPHKQNKRNRNLESVDLNFQTLTYHFQSDLVTNVEGVLLTVFNTDNYKFYAQTDGHHEKIVRVDSTKVNLRSIALGIAASKPICLSGPVGCGKTTLVEYLARKTGHVCPKPTEVTKSVSGQVNKENQKGNNKAIDVHSDKKKAKGVLLHCSGNSAVSTDLASTDGNEILPSDVNGFLRIQLGDQTDSKMLLGQYRCTDVPGEFIWLPGVLTQAVMNGYWLLLEDLDSATQDTYTILSSLLENNFLSVPGFRDCIKIEPGFQLFVTVRTNKSSNSGQKSLYSLLEKYLYTINVLPLSRNELCKVVSSNYPKLTTVANRIVDVFLTFSSGDHSAADNLRQQEQHERADTTEKYLTLPCDDVSLSSIPNSGRLVSTRDLVKLCQRSSPVFSVTSAECAYFVFQNAVDVFCSYLPQSKEKTKLIISIGAKLGIIRSRCEFLANEHKPEVLLDVERIKVGRAELYAKQKIDLNDTVEEEERLQQPAVKKQKVGALSSRTISAVNGSAATKSTFSFTRMSCCLLERIAVCVEHAEPVLLVGETGVGKTSSVQYLAERTQHQLVVVNMNNQSDVSDLVGGYKPVDLTYVVSPLRSEFELLFRQTFNELKNETFLSKFGICYNQGNYSALVKLMLKVVNSVAEKSERGELRQTEQLVLLPRWQQLKVKLQKLHSQLSKSINISFAFIPGSLVNCIKNGDWVLLDEINLASAETLECLSTILEPDGSVVLLEKGDFTPVKRHPDFRIFACMNPNTDIGKKDLSVGIRNRFTEFFADDLTTDADLTLLVSDYLYNTGIQKRSVSNIVRLYKQLKELSRLELNDGLGNRPVFSLRTLCRSLRTCAKNLCGSIERNLYESFCMSFLTQLDPASHNIVLRLIQEALLSNAKAVLKQAIPKPSGNYLDFEGYWIQQGPKTPQECENYILTASVKANLKDLARIISIGKLPVLLQGPTSAGKTSLIEYVAKRSGNYCLRINNHEHTDLQEYIGTYMADVSGKLSFHEGVLVQAMRNGFWLILDELNLASTDILEALNRVLDDNHELFIPETQTVVKAHANFMLFATQNPPGLYGGRKTLSRAFKNRFIELHFADIPRPELEIILEKRCLIPASYAKKMVMCMSDLQKNRKTTSKNVFTLRDLFRWGNRYTFADKGLLEDHKYDWNQHLVEEGYLVLSAKVRTETEIEIIEETLYRNFRKRLNLELLFDAQTEQQSSPVTRSIIQTIKTHKLRQDIVWTRNMTRMAVLTAKALQFNEPVLLVGPTGCGKTTVCQILASIKAVQLRILNCHMHTEGADFLGGLRPCRQTDGDSKKLFEWADGPLIYAMREGTYFMADEISLAEDSVLERLNCVLEPERTLLLAEKGGLTDGTNTFGTEFIVQAAEGFQFLATMNPGGDFGKKELSPALRNRFTEIWCLPTEAKEDLIQIASNCMHEKSQGDMSKAYATLLSSYLVEVVLYMRDTVEKFKYSVRDILAWANYMVVNASLSFAEKAIFGLETVFLDALEMLPHESTEQVELLRAQIIQFAMEQAHSILNEQFSLSTLDAKRGKEVEFRERDFGIKPFYIPINTEVTVLPNANFLFEAPTTKRNLFRLLSALLLKKPVLLEGPPGVGKTSTVESVAHAIGYRIVRINLCEHTDLADLFGTDLPAEDCVFETACHEEQTKYDPPNAGSFVWRDGPLLAALKAKNTWILLDELNLAPQSVLEGLNAILDHRGEVYIPELNKTFELGKETRIFACQNPLKQGGGRKGLPQSFLNRFNKVYLRKLSTEDLLYVVNAKYAAHFDRLGAHFMSSLSNCILPNQMESLFDVYRFWSEVKPALEPEAATPKLTFDLAQRLVKFSEKLDQSMIAMEFGYKGGPYEFNLRDILRCCELLVHTETGFVCQPTHLNAPLEFREHFSRFLLILYERMKLVYYQRMRDEQDKLFIRNTFAAIFCCDAEQLNALSEDVSLYWTKSKIYLNDIVLERELEHRTTRPALRSAQLSPLLLSSQREVLKHVAECVHMEKPVLLCGAADTGKTKIINAMCTLTHQLCNTDTIDDSVTGSFQQIDLNRHLEEISKQVESILTTCMQKSVFARNKLTGLAELLNVWNTYTSLGTTKIDLNNSCTISEELTLFRKRMHALENAIEKLIDSSFLHKKNKDAFVESTLKEPLRLLKLLQKHINSTRSLNTGGSFEWIDSQIVKSLKLGQYILLEHVNLCSSAVLDRLNPVFEPNGSLLISEKGVSSNESAEVVHKAPNFRAFLTIDPKHGELSRAMRNRCVELCVTKDTLHADDLRAIVHAQGVHDVGVIDCLLQLHERVCQLTELHVYNLSHLTQCAQLTASYKRIDYNWERAIYVSAMEVYVYSCNTDYMGYGLAFYQNKLREIVVEETGNCAALHLQGYEELDLLSDAILNTGALSELALIKLQAAPLQLLLKSDEGIPKERLCRLFKDFESINFEGLSQQQLTNSFIYLLYECCSLADVKLRHFYVQKMLSSYTAERRLSQQLFECVQGVKAFFTKAALTDLPWNTKLFPRIRDYAAVATKDAIYQAYCLSASLLSQLLLEAVPQMQFAKLSQTNVLAYSQAVAAQHITDKLNNTFLKLFSTFMQRCLEVVVTSAKSAHFDLGSYSRYMTALLWSNRLLHTSKEQLFVGKELDANLLHKLLLHFKWLEKHLLNLLTEVLPNYLQSNADFALTLKQLNSYAASVKPPLNLLRKTYAKRMTLFQPFYQEEQIKLNALTQQLDQLLNVVPRYGSFAPHFVLKKLLAQRSDAAKRTRSVLTKYADNSFNYNFKEGNISESCLEPLPNALKVALLQFTNGIKELPNNAIEDSDLEALTTDIAAIEEIVKMQLHEEQEENRTPESSQLKEVELRLLPLREYFLSKALLHGMSMACEPAAPESDINLMYCEATPSLTPNTWQLVQLLSTPKHKSFARLHKVLSAHLDKIAGPKEFEELILHLGDNYKCVSSHQRLVHTAQLKQQLTSLAIHQRCVDVLNSNDELDTRYVYEGPSLTNAFQALLFQPDGSLKPVPLNELTIWRSSLQQAQQLLWQNALLLCPAYGGQLNQLKATRVQTKKLLHEVDYVMQLLQEHSATLDCTSATDYNNGFQELVRTLSSVYEESTAAEGQRNTNQTVQQMEYQNSTLNALIGAIELCLLTYTPLIDPVEKNRLKQAYIVEDINCLTTLTTAYDLMRIVMSYKNFGAEIYNALAARLHRLREKQQQSSRKVPIRPPQCLYTNLVQDVTHFLQTNGTPQSLHKLLQNCRVAWTALSSNVATARLQKSVEHCTETLNKVDLWLANAQRFTSHVLRRYADHYQDFLQPLRCSVEHLRFGFEGMKATLTQLKSAALQQCQYNNNNNNLHALLLNVVDFPAIQPLQVLEAHRSKERPFKTAHLPLYQILEQVPSSELNYFQLLKVKLNELQNLTNIGASIDADVFGEFDSVLSLCNRLWQQEEERRRKKQADDDSLYVHKTKCAEEDEAYVELQEIEELFPTSVQEDYGDLLPNDTLEQTIKAPKKDLGTNASVTVVHDDDYSFLAELFSSFLVQHTHVYYSKGSAEAGKQHVELLAPFAQRMRIFIRLYTHYKQSLNGWLDPQLSNSFALALGLQQQALNELSIAPMEQTVAYNYYKDANLPEISHCVEVLQCIEERVDEQLALYPEHATLQDIKSVIERIRKLPSTAPVVRFNTGFQLLRQRVAQWNEVAHKQNHLRPEEIEVAAYVQKWTKLELQCWRNCLSQTEQQVAAQAHKYWFFIYNLMQEFLLGHELDSSFTQIKYTEQRFVEGAPLEAADMQQKSTVAVGDIVRILRQFVEAACYGDFQVRIELLQSFELYLHQVGRHCSSAHALGTVQRQELIAGLRNLQVYFAQFGDEIEETKRAARAPIEKKLREFVKIESYNKDLSYFSMRNSVARVHRQLNKFLKEYRQALQQKITPAFQPKDATVRDYNFASGKGKDLRYDTKIKYYLVDAKHFVAPQSLREKYAPADVSAKMPTEGGAEGQELLPKVGRLFATARNIVKETVSSAPYPKLIIALDVLLTEQLERCEHLRGLSVDRTKERPKQVLQAKQILQQKRKGLTDIFKILAQLGLSFKSGLLELSLQDEFMDYTLPPYCIKTMFGAQKDKRWMHSNILQLNEHLDRYYAKCAFKLKLLQNLMLTPLSELGPPLIERIKGFAVDLFLLVQQQRRHLGHTARSIYELQTAIQRLRIVAEVCAPSEVAARKGNKCDKLGFDQLQQVYSRLRQSFCRTRYAFEQFNLLLACMPRQQSTDNLVLAAGNDVPVCRGSPQFAIIAEHCQQVLQLSKNTLADLQKVDAEFPNANTINSFYIAHTKMVDSIIRIRDTFKVSNSDDYLPMAKCLEELLEFIEQCNVDGETNQVATQPEACKGIEAALEQVAHAVLLALQKLFKKHAPTSLPVEDHKLANSRTKHNDASPTEKSEESDELQDQHLKKQLHGALMTDWETLHPATVLDRLTSVLLSLQQMPVSLEVLACMRKAASLLPLLEQYQLMAEYYLLQQLGAHKVSAKMLSVMLTAFVEISTKGFCVPPDLMQAEEGEAKQEQHKGEGLGLEDGTGEKDASDKIESEDQLENAKRPEDQKNDEENNKDCKEEKGIELSEDFEGKMQDMEKPEKEEDDSGESEDEEDLNKEMGETEEGAEKLDDQIWGGDDEEEQEEEEKELNEEEQGKGTKDEKDSHNDLNAKNDAAPETDQNDEQEQEGLDATDDLKSDKRKQQEKDIDNMQEPEVDEEQTNPYHNELEEPPEPEEMDLDNMRNVDEGQDEGDREQQGDENPFDIDTMKENMQTTEEQNGDEDEEKEHDKDQAEETDSEDDDSDVEMKEDKQANEAKNKDDEGDDRNEEVNEDEPETQKRGEMDVDDEEEAEKQEEEEKRDEQLPEEYEQSKDKSSKEENVQAKPEKENKGSADQVQNEQAEKDVTQDQKLDEQETGEEKDGVGQAENEETSDGHQGIAEAKETVAQKEKRQERKSQEKRRQGRTNEERTLGEAEKNEIKQLKTIDKLKEHNPKDTQNEDDPEQEKDEAEAEEYQHVKEPKNSDKTTLDNATEEQSKKIQHLEDEKKDDEEAGADESPDDLLAEDATENHDDDEHLEELSAEKLNDKSEKSAKSTDKTKERAEAQEQVEVEGEIVLTTNVARGTDTTAHCINEILQENTAQAVELSAAETIELRKLYQQQLTSNKGTLAQHADYESWQSISSRMAQNARELCEQLRLILEPTKCTRLKGDYRTGRRINMKKIIPYIASQFRKDKIWLRRTKPAQRDYKITIAIDDSKSMHHNNSKTLTLEAISLVSQALTLLESGRLSIVSFGEAPRIILHHTEQFDGPKLVNSLNFEQNKTRIADLLDFTRTANTEDGVGGGDTGLFENLLLVLSDGRNIFSEGKAKVKNAIKLARLQRIFLVYIIIDNPENKNSILDIQTMEMLPDKSISIKSYLDDFPFPYYVIVRDLNQLPLVLSEAMRQWFELVNSEQ